MPLKEEFTQLLASYPDLLQQGEASLALLIPPACRLACFIGSLPVGETTQVKPPSRSLHQELCTRMSGLSALGKCIFSVLWRRPRTPNVGVISAQGWSTHENACYDIWTERCHIFAVRR
jgi:hypothetical protein